jgi:hypothetical protein
MAVVYPIIFRILAARTVVVGTRIWKGVKSPYGYKLLIV